MDLIDKLNLFINEKIWSGKVKTKYSPPEGTFEKSAEAIATQMHKDSSDLKQAMSRLNFYINRAGKNLPKGRISVLNKAKELLRKKYGK